MRSVSGVGRVAAIGAVVAAVVLVAFILFGAGSSSYEITAKFINAGQIVKGNPVQTGGTAIGTVTGIDITDDGQAEIKMEIKADHAPLRVGTRAAIRQFSQSGIANRYIDLSFPPNGAEALDDGGRIDTDRTETAVDLDQLFNTLDEETRGDLQQFFQNQAAQFRGAGVPAQETFRYLNPALATSSRLFNELTRDEPLLERFLVDSSQLVTALAERRDDLGALIGNLATTTTALGSQKEALAQTISELPPFMRRANTTFVNLRAALDDVDPLVTASEPVADRLAPFLASARSFTAAAEPTIADLRQVVRRPGRGNDLIDYLRTMPRLNDIALETKERNGADRPGAFPATIEGFQDGAPIISEARPYTPDFLGWLDDFSTTGGGFDALGAYARGRISFAENLRGTPLTPTPVKRDQFRRCPGGAESVASDTSNFLPEEERARLGCDETDRATGP